MLITSSLMAYQFLKNKFTLDVEEFWILALDSKKSVIDSRCLFRGTVDACLVHPRDIFRFACMTNSSAVLIAHNHPSNDPQPSDHDIRVTQRIIKCSQLLQIPVIDHLILTKDGYTSFRDSKVKPFH